MGKLPRSIAPFLVLCVGAARGSESEDASMPQTFRDGGHEPWMVAIPPGRLWKKTALPLAGALA